MNINGEDVNEKLFQAIDPNHPYTMAEFDVEFNSTNHTANTPLNSEAFKIPIKFVNESDNQDPEFQTAGAAGFDFRANLDAPILLKGSNGLNGFKQKLSNTGIIPTGLFFEIPETLELQVRPRSGLAAKHSVTVLNSPGTIDSDYRGEVKVILINHGYEDFVINNGDRIAQGVIAVVSNSQFVNLTKVDELNNNTDRGVNGFGSTGYH